MIAVEEMIKVSKDNIAKVKKLQKRLKKIKNWLIKNEKRTDKAKTLVIKRDSYFKGIVAKRKHIAKQLKEIRTKTFASRKNLVNIQIKLEILLREGKNQVNNYVKQFEQILIKFVNMRKKVNTNGKLKRVKLAEVERKEKAAKKVSDEKNKIFKNHVKKANKALKKYRNQKNKIRVAVKNAQKAKKVADKNKTNKTVQNYVTAVTTVNKERANLKVLYNNAKLEIKSRKGARTDKFKAIKLWKKEVRNVKRIKIRVKLLSRRSKLYRKYILNLRKNIVAKKAVVGNLGRRIQIKVAARERFITQRKVAARKRAEKWAKIRAEAKKRQLQRAEWRKKELERRVKQLAKLASQLKDETAKKKAEEATRKAKIAAEKAAALARKRAAEKARLERIRKEKERLRKIAEAKAKAAREAARRRAEELKRQKELERQRKLAELERQRKLAEQRRKRLAKIARKKAEAKRKAAIREAKRRARLAEIARQKKIAAEKAEAERKRLAEIARKKAERERKRRIASEKARKEAIRKAKELARIAKAKADAESRRKAEEARKVAEEAKRKAEEARKRAKAARIARAKAEAARKKAERERKRRERLAKIAAEKARRKKIEAERRRREAERRRKVEEARRKAIEIARKIRLAKEAARRKRINARNHSANVHTNHLNNRYKWYVNLRTRFARHIRAYYQRFLNWANNKFNWAKYHMRRQHDANRVRQVFNKVWNPVHQQWGRVWKHAHHLRRQRIHHRNRRANINKVHLRNRQRWYYSLARRLRHGGSKQHYNKFLRYMIGKFNWARHHMPRQWDSRGVNHIYHRIWSPVHRVWGRYWRHSNNLQRNWLRRRRRNKNFMKHFRNGRKIRLRT